LAASLLALAELVCCSPVRGQGTSPASAPVPFHLFLLDDSASMEADDDGSLTGISEDARRRVRLRNALGGFLGGATGCEIELVTFGASIGRCPVAMLRNPGDGTALVAEMESRFGSMMRGEPGTRLYEVLCRTLPEVRDRVTGAPHGPVFIHLYTDGEDNDPDGAAPAEAARKQRERLDTIRALLGELCALRGGTGEGKAPAVRYSEPLVSLEYLAFGNAFDRGLRRVLDQYRDCLQIVEGDIRKLVRWSCTPTSITLQSFSEEPSQEETLALYPALEVPGYAADIDATGLPPGIRLTAPSPLGIGRGLAAKLTFTGTPACDGLSGELVITARDPEDPAQRRYRLQDPVLKVPVAVAKATPLRLEWDGIEGGSEASIPLLVHEARGVKIRVVNGPLKGALTWECAEPIRWAPGEPKQTILFGREGEYAITVTGTSARLGASGQAQVAQAKLIAKVVDWGGYFKSYAKPVVAGRPVDIEFVPVGDVDVAQSRWTVGGTEPDRSWLCADRARLKCTFAQPGRQELRVRMFSSRRGANLPPKELGPLTVDVVPAPAIRVIRPTPGAVVYSGRGVPFEVANADEFRDLAWTIDRLKYPVCLGARSYLHEFAPGQEGDKTAVVRGTSVQDGQSYEAQVAFRVRAPRELRIASPQQHQQFMLPPTGTVSVPFAIEPQSLAGLKRETIAWALPSPGGRVERREEAPQCEYGDEYRGTATVQAQTVDGEPVMASVSFSVVRGIGLLIRKPPSNSTVNACTPVIFELASPEAFQDVKWAVGKEAALDGGSVEHIFRQTGDVTVTATARARHSGQGLSASLVLHVAPPELRILEPVAGQRVSAGQPFRVTPTLRGTVEDLVWAFADAKGVPVTPRDEGPALVSLGQVGVHRVSVKGRTCLGELTDAVEVEVVLEPCVARLNASSAPPYWVHTRVGFEVVGCPVDQVAWTVDGARWPEGGPGISPPMDTHGTHRITATPVSGGVPGQTLAIEVPVVTHGLEARPVVMRNEKAVTSVHQGELVGLRNQASDASDITKTTWEHVLPGADPAGQVLDKPQAEVPERGTHTFRLRVEGYPDTAGNTDRRTAEVLLQVRRWAPVPFALGALALLVAAVVSLIGVVRYFGWNQPRFWEVHYAERAGQAEVRDPVVLVREVWSRRTKEARWSVGELFKATTLQGDIVVTLGGIDSSPPGLVFEETAEGGNLRTYRHYYLKDRVQPEGAGGKASAGTPGTTQGAKGSVLSRMRGALAKAAQQGAGQGGTTQGQVRRRLLLAMNRGFGLDEWMLVLLPIVIVGGSVVGTFWLWQRFMT